MHPAPSQKQFKQLRASARQSLTNLAVILPPPVTLVTGKPPACWSKAQALGGCQGL